MTAPIYVATEWDVDVFEPGPGLPILINRYGTLITDQTVLNNVLLAAGLSHVSLLLAQTGPAIPPNLQPVTITAIIAGANITVDNTNPQHPVVSASGGGGGGGTDPGAVRFDGTQSLSGPQQLVARGNIGAMASGAQDPGVVRFDTTQSLTSGQQAAARTNIGAAATGGGTGGGTAQTATSVAYDPRTSGIPGDTNCPPVPAYNVQDALDILNRRITDYAQHIYQESLRDAGRLAQALGNASPQTTDDGTYYGFVIMPGQPTAVNQTVKVTGGSAGAWIYGWA